MTKLLPKIAKLAPKMTKLASKIAKLAPKLAKLAPKKLFTLRESRRGQLEARGQETGTSVFWQHPIREFQKPETPEQHGVKWQWNGIKGHGMQRHTMEWNGMQWNGVEGNRMERQSNGMIILQAH